MMRRFTATIGVALSFAATPLVAQQQQGSPIDDLLKRAGDAFNDLNYSRADSLARQVLAIGSRVSAGQRTRALMVMAAASFPEEASAQKRAVALQTLKQIVRTNLSLKLPPELTWAGLDSLVDEARRTTYGIEVSADSMQVIVGPTGTGRLMARTNRPGTLQLTIMPSTGGGPAAIVDSTPVGMSGEFTFTAMRGERPVFATGDYAVILTGVDSATKDTVTVRYTAVVDAPALTFMTVPAKMDSSKLLPERTGKFGAKSIVPGVLVGGAAFALASVLRAEGDIKTKVGADSKGVAVGGALALTTILAGFADKGRAIPANILANRTYGAAFQKSIVDSQAENRRRIAEYKTTIKFDLENR